MVDNVFLSLLLGIPCIIIISVLIFIILNSKIFNSFKEFEYDYTTGFPKDFTFQQSVHSIRTPFAFKIKGQDVDYIVNTYIKGYIEIKYCPLLDIDNFFNKKIYCTTKMIMRFFDEQGKEIDPENITHYIPLKISWRDYYKNKFQSA